MNLAQVPDKEPVKLKAEGIERTTQNYQASAFGKQAENTPIYF